MILSLCVSIKEIVECEAVIFHGRDLNVVLDAGVIGSGGMDSLGLCSMVFWSGSSEALALPRLSMCHEGSTRRVL